MIYKYGIVSGYFNPLHYGHIEYFNEAKKQCDELIVVVNNDYQVNLKGSKKFMDALHRANIVHSIKGVDFAFVSVDIDKTVCESIRYLRSLWPNDNMAFFNSGDRTADTVDTAEKDVCLELNIGFILLNQEKKYSSSELLK